MKAEIVYLLWRMEALRERGGEVTTDQRNRVWDWLWADLCTRAEKLDADDAKKVRLSGVATRLPHRVNALNLLGSEEMIGTHNKVGLDVLIVTIIEEEFNSVLAVFGIDRRTTPPIEEIFGHLVYYCEVEKYGGKGKIRVGITIIGEARNVRCANFCRSMFKLTSADTAILVGIAGGFKDKVNIGDVVGSCDVWDYEGGRVDMDRVLPEPDFHKSDGPIRNLFKAFNPLRDNEWKEEWGSVVERLAGTNAQVPKNFDVEKIRYVEGVMACGEKVRRDNLLPTLNEEQHRKIYAVEMEGSGFAAAAKEDNKQWLIIRGIADYGNKRKRDEWQAVAAAMAGLVCKSFLRYGMR